MEGVNYNIVIISDQAVRAEIISNLIKNDFHQITNIPVLSVEEIDSLNELASPLLLLLDLIGTNKSSKQIILSIQRAFPDTKIIALHFYRSSILVNPLLNMGVHGYIYYEPSRKELVQAIEKVIAGKKYIPNYLIST